VPKRDIALVGEDDPEPNCYVPPIAFTKVLNTGHPYELIDERVGRKTSVPPKGIDFLQRDENDKSKWKPIKMLGRGGYGCVYL